MKILYTERLTIRPFQMRDLDAFFAYAKTPDVGPNAGWKPHANKEESARLLVDFIEKDESWAITDRETGKLMGSIGLHEDQARGYRRARSLGYVLASECWGRGLATEAAKAVIAYAFDDLGADIVSVRHYPFNLRSKRVIEKCGFTYEGTLRRAVLLYDGSIQDCVCYSMLREEYHSGMDRV